MNSKESRIGQRIYKWLSYLVALTFIVMGLGILAKVLWPEPFLSQGLQRYILGGVVLAYGTIRTIMIYSKSSSRRT